MGGWARAVMRVSRNLTNRHNNTIPTCDLSRKNMTVLAVIAAMLGLSGSGRYYILISFWMYISVGFEYDRNIH